MTQVTPDQAMRLADAHHQAGRLAEAEAIYRQVLAQNPAYPQALHLLGVLMGQSGKSDVAADLIARAAEIQPDNAFIQNDLGKFLRDLRRLDGALAAAEQAVRINPGYADGHYNLGLSLFALGRRDQAIVAFARAAHLNPDFVEAHNNLGAALNESGRFDEAIIHLNRAICLKPDYARAHLNLAHAARAKGCIPEAVAAAEKAIQSNPKFAEAFGILGVALRDRGQLAQAAAAFVRAIQLDPNQAEFHNNLGITLSDLDKIEPAIASLQRAIEISPKFAEAHSNLAYLLLILGDFERGLPEFERYLECKPPPGARMFPQPHWQGEDLAGRTILVRSDPCALGDTINYVRFLPLLAARGGRVIFECQPELARILKDIPGADRIIALGNPLPEFDLQCRLLKLLLIFGTGAKSIPQCVPYLKAEARLAQQWNSRLTSAQGKKRIGLVWAGADRQIFKGGRVRSTTLSEMSPLADVRGVQFFSLQMGSAAKQPSPAGLDFINFTPELQDFADTAAFVENLDLIVTVDTAMAHLAGAMGKPVWVVLPFVADWRWLRDRDDSPWYPTMKLFRQKTSGDWAGQFREVAGQLESL